MAFTSSQQGVAVIRAVATVILRESGGSSTPRPIHVIASAAKQSILLYAAAWIGSLRSHAQTLRVVADNDVEIASRSRGAMRPRFCISFRPRNQRAQGMPDARCTRDLACGLHKTKCTRAYRAAENIRHSLRNGFTAYIVLSPVGPSSLSLSLLGSVSLFGT